MAYSPAALERMYDHVERYYSSMRRGGIYADKSGYHNSFNGNSPGNYSTVAPADRRGDRDAARAIDFTMDDPSEMTLMTRRYVDACTPDRHGNYDPRIEWTREGIGTLDGGRTDVTYNRYDSGGSGSRSQVGLLGDWASDDSHEWHFHLSVFTEYATDDEKMLQVTEVLCGLVPGTLAEAAPSIPDKTPEEEDDDMAWTRLYNYRGDTQYLADANKYQTLHVNPDDDKGNPYDITNGPSDVTGVIRFAISGIGLNDSVWLRPYTVDRYSGENEVNVTGADIKIDGTNHGWVKDQRAFTWNLGDAPDDARGRALRFEWKSNRPGANIEEIEVAGWERRV